MYISIFLIAVSLAMDAFAVSICNGIAIKKIKPVHPFIFGFSCGFFQFIMPLIGYFLASKFKAQIEFMDHWIAFMLLLAIGVNMIYETFKDEEENVIENVFTLKNILMVSVATSIDALAVGISFVAIDTNILISSVIIGIVAFIFSFTGILLGKKIGVLFQKNAERVGGIILIVIGFKILIEHLYF